MWDQGKRESHKQIYTGSLLHQEIHPVPRNHWVIHDAIKTRLQTSHTKVVTLNPSRNTLPLANHTKNVDLEHLKSTNTPWQHNYKNTVMKEEGNRIHLRITKLKVQNYNPILFHTFKNDPKLFQMLEKLFW